MENECVDFPFSIFHLCCAEQIGFGAPSRRALSPPNCSRNTEYTVNLTHRVHFPFSIINSPLLHEKRLRNERSEAFL